MSTAGMKKMQVAKRLDAALEAFRRADRYLLEHDLSERCIASRLALHLQSSFPEFSVDVEYNRAGDAAKRLGLPEECANSFDDDGLALVVPDIIIHTRGPDGTNVLGIELKKQHDRRGPNCDRKRISALKERFGYQFGVLIVCETRRVDAASIQVLEWV